MRKTIKIGERLVEFRATASTLRRFNEYTGKDLLVEIQKIKEESEKAGHDVLSTDTMDSFLCFAYTMAKQANNNIPDDPYEWLDDFEVFPLDDVFPKLMSLWKDTMQTHVEEKNGAAD